MIPKSSMIYNDLTGDSMISNDITGDSKEFYDFQWYNWWFQRVPTAAGPWRTLSACSNSSRRQVRMDKWNNEKWMNAWM